MQTAQPFLLQLHLWTITPCIFIGAYLLLRKKSGPKHRVTGKVYMALMLFTSFITLLMPAEVGPQLILHFGWIHLLSVLTLWTVPSAYYAIRKGQVKSHQRKMVLLYIGAILIAGGFTLVPGRYLHEYFFQP